jgi:hypothetical protein
VWLDHHTQVQGKCHEAPPKTPGELGGVAIFLEVATLDILMPLAVALNGGAAGLPTTTAVDFIPEVCCHVARYRRMTLRWRVCIRLRWRCMRNGWCANPRWRTCRGWSARLLRRWLAPPLMVWRVDGGDN